MSRKIRFNYLDRCRMFARYLMIVSWISLLFSCDKIREMDQEPEIHSLQDGLRTCATVGYCASLANTLFRGDPLPENVIFQPVDTDTHSGAGILYVDINSEYPLPLNQSVGQIIIPALWNDDHDGVITILLLDIDLIPFNAGLLGIYTIPVIFQHDTGQILTILAEQDIVVGEGTDTLLNLSLTNPQFDLELDRGSAKKPADAFAAVTQNVWFVLIDPRNTPGNLYDDLFTIHGGGQIVEARSQSGGILYHSMIGTKLDLQYCSRNPVEGIGLIQNFKAGSFFDLGNAVLEFQHDCKGSARVSFASGKYFMSKGDFISLDLY